MSTGALAIVQQSQIQNEWDHPGGLKLIQDTVAPGLNDAEFALFVHVARVRHLDPLQRQIYAIKRSVWDQESNGYVKRMTLQVGIDGFRSIANRTGLYMPSDRLPLVEGSIKEKSLRVTVYVKKYHPMSQQWHEFGATAYYSEMVQTKKDGVTPNSMWEKQPIGQTEKCAEAKALRRGWPEELGQFYTPEEIGPDETPLPPAKKSEEAARREVGTLKQSSEPNRGHGNEGMQRESAAPEVLGKEPVICNECRVVDGHADKCPQNPARKKGGKKTEPKPEQAAVSTKSRAQQWVEYPGHDPAKHISFGQFLELVSLIKELEITDAEAKRWLAEELLIEHRPHIKKSEIADVMAKMRKAFERNFDENEIHDEDIPE